MKTYLAYQSKQSYTHNLRIPTYKGELKTDKIFTDSLDKKRFLTPFCFSPVKMLNSNFGWQISLWRQKIGKLLEDRYSNPRL